jgi:hypothetical protein
MEAPMGPLESWASCASGGAVRAILVLKSRCLVSDVHQSHTTYSFGCSPDQFPQEMIDCWRDLWVQKQLGRNQYRAWLRQQRKAAEKIVAERHA